MLYRDGRQVKLLHVRLSKPNTTSAPVTPGHTTICARPPRDVAADLELVHAMEDESGATLADDDSAPYWHPVPAPAFDVRGAASSDDADGWLAMNKWLAASDHAQLQEQFLAGTGAVLTHVLAGAPHWVAGVSAPSRCYADTFSTATLPSRSVARRPSRPAAQGR